MTTPHKHADMIIAWAKGLPVQYKDFLDKWVDMPFYSVNSFYGWHDKTNYRIKPEPVKDVIKYVGVGVEAEDPAVRLTAAYNKPHRLSTIEGPNGGIYHINNTLKLTIDGTTRKVKHVEVL